MTHQITRKLKSVIEDAIYDTFSGHFHPDEWERLPREFWIQVESEVEKQGIIPDLVTLADFTDEEIHSENIRRRYEFVEPLW